ncbi:hypothetical protein ACFOMD_09025 [Sphingoaurantiacus capsulatus]|uniref:Secreted protein n=1 Tax=Sphingoaurantiacus capsulatus TaxID=1771310 RepID=A0ABV7X9A1_9SPHN
MRKTLLASLLLGLAAPATATPQDDFFARLTALCGKSFAGTVETNDPADADFAGKPLVMQVRSCTADTIRIPFHVGDDRSRTWVISRTKDGLRLKHDHRHKDGSEDKLTQYGGDTAAAGSAGRQAYPVDDFSKKMFVSEGRQVSTTNVWAVEVEPGKTFVYELSRPNRLFRVRFDLTKVVNDPPPPWGN